MLGETTPDGRVVTYTRDALERITSVTATVHGTMVTLVTQMTWCADNLLSSETWVNGLGETRDYDYAGRLTTQTIGTDTRVYGYDANGNLTSLQTLPAVDCYGYDRVDRITPGTVLTTLGASCPAATPGHPCIRTMPMATAQARPPAPRPSLIPTPPPATGSRP
ncbi:MAG: hypothetical protein ACYDHM_16115 [Acidiferrobacterales bacterium]